MGNDDQTSEGSFPVVEGSTVLPGEQSGGESESFARMGPGPELVGRLAGLVVADVPDAVLVEMLKADERVKAACDGRQLLVMTELARRRPVGVSVGIEIGDLRVDEFCVEEVACALTVERPQADRCLNLGVGLSQRLPRVLSALCAGRIDLMKAQMLHQMTEHLSQVDAERIADQGLVRASSQTYQRVRECARRRAYKVRPRETAKVSRRRAEKARDVRVYEAEDGNAAMVVTMGAGDVAAAYAIINSAAHQAKSPGDGRTIGQVRADTLMDFILGRTPTRSGATRQDGNNDSNDSNEDDHGSCRGGGNAAGGASARVGARTVVKVTIPLSEFLRLYHPDPDDNPDHPAGPGEESASSPGEIQGVGYVAGYVAGWVIRDLVRDAADRSGTAFRGVIYDDATGTFVAATSLKYRVPAGLGEHIQLRTAGDHLGNRFDDYPDETSATPDEAAHAG